MVTGHWGPTTCVSPRAGGRPGSSQDLYRGTAFDSSHVRRSHRALFLCLPCTRFHEKECRAEGRTAGAALLAKTEKTTAADLMATEPIPSPDESVSQPLPPAVMEVRETPRSWGEHL